MYSDTMKAWRVGSYLEDSSGTRDFGLNLVQSLVLKDEVTGKL
jgi:hypothetical protein